jgi:hypothetical protein
LRWTKRSSQGFILSVDNFHLFVDAEAQKADQEREEPGQEARVAAGADNNSKQQ